MLLQFLRVGIHDAKQRHGGRNSWTLTFQSKKEAKITLRPERGYVCYSFPDKSTHWGPSMRTHSHTTSDLTLSLYFGLISISLLSSLSLSGFLNVLIFVPFIAPRELPWTWTSSSNTNLDQDLMLPFFFFYYAVLQEVAISSIPNLKNSF